MGVERRSSQRHLPADRRPDQGERPRRNSPALIPMPNWSVEERVNRLARATLVAEYLVKEWAEHMRGMEKPQLEELARSFHFSNCLQRDGLNEVLRAHAHAADP